MTWPATFDSPEQVIEEGERLIRASYWESVKSFAEEALAEHPRDPERQIDHAMESVDGSSWVTYTNESLQVLRATRNDAAFAEHGELPSTTDPYAIYECIARYAMRADVLEQLTELQASADDIEPGSVISGTMRPEDLIPAFLDELERIDPETGRQFRRRLQNARSGAGRSTGMEEQATLLLDGLFEALAERAPDGLTFGAHPGDGADFGWWPLDD